MANGGIEMKRKIGEMLAMKYEEKMAIIMARNSAKAKSARRQ